MDVDHLATNPSAIEVLQQKEEIEIIRNAIAKLPEIQRQCIEDFLNGSNQAVTANEADISPEAVSQAKQRALRNLYITLSQYFPEKVFYQRITELGLGHLRPLITSKCYH